MSTWTATIALKERCTECHGTGAYSTYRPGDSGKPCWGCHGRGWVKRRMDAPDSKWAREYNKEQKNMYNEERKAA